MISNRVALVAGIICAAAMLFLLMPGLLLARDKGQWKYANPSLSQWYSTLMMPDMPTTSCCGAGDAYYADKTETGPRGELLAIITDVRDDGDLMRQHVDVGTKIEVPATKLRKHPIPNPTDHTVIFIGPAPAHVVYCYEPVGLF